MGPLFSVQSLRLRSSFYIREYGTTVEPAGHIDFAAQPQKAARGRCAAARCVVLPPVLEQVGSFLRRFADIAESIGEWCCASLWLMQTQRRLAHVACCWRAVPRNKDARCTVVWQYHCVALVFAKVSFRM